MEGLRILIADNSPVYKKMFVSASAEADENASVTNVDDGGKALELIKRQNYDIIVIDAEISGVTLIDLLKRIKLNIPKAFVLVTARPSIAGYELFNEALSKGAAGCMTKPIYDSYADNFDIIKRKMIEIIAGLHNDEDANRHKAKIKGGDGLAAPAAKKQTKKPPWDIVLIAASTGGPFALETVLSKLRGDFPAPILAVQHIPPHFTENLAHSLDSKSQLLVKVADAGETVQAGTVYLAPGGAHMKLDSKNRIHLDGSQPINGVRPAADALFRSVAETFSGAGVLVVVLTGMGYDGRDGLAKLKENKDCYCLAQSEKTCVVYGMPRAAVEAGLADQIIDLEKIPAEIEGLYEDYLTNGL